MKQDNFIDSYNMTWILQDHETKKKHREDYENISLSDFETIYGNNTFHIVEVSLVHVPYLTPDPNQITLDV